MLSVMADIIPFPNNNNNQPLEAAKRSDVPVGLFEKLQGYFHDKKRILGGLACVVALGVSVPRIMEIQEASTPTIPNKEEVTTAKKDGSLEQKFVSRQVQKNETEFGIASQYTDKEHSIYSNVNAIADQVNGRSELVAGETIYVPVTTVPADKR